MSLILAHHGMNGNLSWREWFVIHDGVLLHPCFEKINLILAAFPPSLASSGVPRKCNSSSFSLSLYRHCNIIQLHSHIPLRLQVILRSLCSRLWGLLLLQLGAATAADARLLSSKPQLIYLQQLS